MRVLITGVNGQDGSYLAELLATDPDIELFGTLRSPDHPRREWIQRLVPDMQLLYMDLLDRASIDDALEESDPDAIYHLAAMSSPGQAWTQPELCAQITGIGVLRLLESAKRYDLTCCRIVVAGSLATHGPYGAAKTYARAIAADARAHGQHVSVAVMAGHHSPRRAPSYLAAKVARHALATVYGAPGALQLGPLDRMQDWGWAPDFMPALIEISEMPPGDYTVATGDPHSVKEYVAACYAAVGLDWEDHVVLDVNAGNPVDVPLVSALPDERLTWRPTVGFDEIVRRMAAGD